MNVRAEWVLVAALTLLPLAGHGFWFGKKSAEGATPSPGFTRRYVLRIPNKPAEQELLALFAGKRLVLQQTQTLRQLNEEKQREMADFNRKLKDEFSLSEGVLYDYDAATRSIYRMEKSAGAADAGDGRKELHLRLVSDTQVSRFQALHMGKVFVLDQLKVFESVIREKQHEARQIDAKLDERFSIANNRNYQYEPKTMRLFEVEPAAAPASPVPEDDLGMLFQTPVPMR